MKYQSGDQYQEEFSFSQADVEAFARVTGDHNPIHTEAEAAAAAGYKQPILHGMLGASIFTRLVGMHFPGHGTVYLEQTFQFKRPMYADHAYRAELRILELDEAKHRAKIETKIVQVSDGKPVLLGEAYVMNKDRF